MHQPAFAAKVQGAWQNRCLVLGALHLERDAVDMEKYVQWSLAAPLRSEIGTTMDS